MLRGKFFIKNVLSGAESSTMLHCGDGISQERCCAWFPPRGGVQSLSHQTGDLFESERPSRHREREKKKESKNLVHLLRHVTLNQLDLCSDIHY